MILVGGSWFKSPYLHYGVAQIESASHGAGGRSFANCRRSHRGETERQSSGLLIRMLRVRLPSPPLDKVGSLVLWNLHSLSQLRYSESLSSLRADSNLARWSSWFRTRPSQG